MVFEVINFCSLIVSNLEDGCSFILENSCASYKFVWHGRKISRKFNTYAIGLIASCLYIIFCFNPSFEKLLLHKMFIEGGWLYPPEILTSSYVMKLKLRSFAHLLVLSLIFNIQTRRGFTICKEIEKMEGNVICFVLLLCEWPWENNVCMCRCFRHKVWEYQNISTKSLVPFWKFCEKFPDLFRKYWKF